MILYFVLILLVVNYIGYINSKVMEHLDQTVCETVRRSFEAQMDCFSDGQRFMGWSPALSSAATRNLEIV